MSKRYGNRAGQRRGHQRARLRKLFWFGADNRVRLWSMPTGQAPFTYVDPGPPAQTEFWGMMTW